MPVHTLGLVMHVEGYPPILNIPEPSKNHIAMNAQICISKYCLITKTQT
jgi:hypothetical protein